MIIPDRRNEPAELVATLQGRHVKNGDRDEYQPCMRRSGASRNVSHSLVIVRAMSPLTIPLAGPLQNGDFVR
jgi:hypothetical protein